MKYTIHNDKVWVWITNHSGPMYQCFSPYIKGAPHATAMYTVSELAKMRMYGVYIPWEDEKGYNKTVEKLLIANGGKYTGDLNNINVVRRRLFVYDGHSTYFTNSPESLQRQIEVNLTQIAGYEIHPLWRGWTIMSKRFYYLKGNEIAGIGSYIPEEKLHRFIGDVQEVITVL